MSTSIFLGLIILLNIIFALIIVFLEKKDAATTWAWLFVLTFIPILGFLLYLLLGQNLRRSKLFQWEDKKKIGVDRLLQKQIESLEQGSFEFCPEVSRDKMDLVYMHLMGNRAVYSNNNEVEILIDGHEKFRRLFSDLEQAKKHIHLQYYIIRNDHLGKKLRDLLVKKAKEGVIVRVLYDELGSRRITRRFFRELREAGGKVEAFFPSILPLINMKLNYRNHRKLVIIDGKVGYVGGFNVGDEYLGLVPKFGYWRDTHLRLKGSAVYEIQTRFILDWNQASDRDDILYEESLYPKVESQGNVAMQIVTSGPDSEWPQIKNGFIKMISLAKSSVRIQTPYFIPDDSLMDAVRIACLSGVDVKIMIPNKPDHLFVYWATLSYVGELLKAGAKVYIYDKGFIHAKTIVVDEEISTVGTANMDNRSLALNFEINAFIYDKAVAKKLTSYFEQDLVFSRELTLETYRNRSKWIRFKESISRLLSPIL